MEMAALAAARGWLPHALQTEKAEIANNLVFFFFFFFAGAHWVGMSDVEEMFLYYLLYVTPDTRYDILVDTVSQQQLQNSDILVKFC